MTSDLLSLSDRLPLICHFHCSSRVQHKQKLVNSWYFLPEPMTDRSSALAVWICLQKISCVYIDRHYINTATQIDPWRLFFLSTQVIHELWNGVTGMRWSLSTQRCCLSLLLHWVNNCREGERERTAEWVRGQKDEWIREWMNEWLRSINVTVQPRLKGRSVVQPDKNKRRWWQLSE